VHEGKKTENIMANTTRTTKRSTGQKKRTQRQHALKDLRHRPDASKQVQGGANGGAWFLRNTNSPGLANH